MAKGRRTLTRGIVKAHRFSALLLASLSAVYSIACDDDSVRPSTPESTAFITLTTEHPFPAGAVAELWGSSTDDIHAVGWYGNVLHYDGTEWSVDYTDGTSFVDVWGTAPNDVYAVGFGGALFHFDGSTWKRRDSGTSQPLYGVWGSAPDTVYVVGWSGTVLRFDGRAWTSLSPPTSSDLTSIWGADSHNMYVGASEALFHFDGETWTDVGIRPYDRIWAIWGSSASDIWVSEGTNILWHFDGSNWRYTHSLLNHAFTNFWGTAQDNVFGVGDDGLVAHYDGTRWSEVLLGNMLLTGVWGTSGNDVWVSGSKKGRGGALFHFDGINWVEASWDLGIDLLLDVWCDEVGERALAVGSNGALVSRVNGRWERVPVSTVQHLNAVWSATTGEAFVGGNGGTCLHFDGVAWNEVNLGTAVQFTSIWGAARDDVYMGSNSGLWHFDGTTWSNIGVLGYVNGVWGTSASNVFVTGNDSNFERAYVFRFDGANWHSIYSRESAYFRWPTGADRYEVVIVSYMNSENRSRLLGYNGSLWDGVWKDISPPGATHFGPTGGNARVGLVVSGHNIDGHAVVDQSLFRLIDGRWENRSSPDFSAISTGFETGVYLVGGGGNYIVRGDLR